VVEGTYKWKVIGSPAIVAYDVGLGRKLVACPTADNPSHRLVKIHTDHHVGARGHLRYVSNFPHWGRYEFELGDAR
jgi:hypothetical protein